MKVTTQYAQEHFVELLETADQGEEIEIARAGKPSARLTILQSTTQHKREAIPDSCALDAHSGSENSTPVFGTGRGEIVLPSDEEWKDMDREIERLMLNGSLLPNSSR